MKKYNQNLNVSGNKVYSYDTHVATINGGNLIKLGYWSSTTSKHINYVAKEYGLTVIDATKEQKEETKDETYNPLKTASLVASLASVFTKTPKEKNDWMKRMLATTPGINFPEDWDTLNEDEKERRLSGVVKIGLTN